MFFTLEFSPDVPWGINIIFYSRGLFLNFNKSHRKMTHFFVFETVLSEKANQIPSGCQFESHKKKKKSNTYSAQTEPQSG